MQRENDRTEPFCLPAQVGTRSRLIRVSTSDGLVWRTASDGRYTPARPASHIWKGSVDMLRRPFNFKAGFSGLRMRMHRTLRRAGVSIRDRQSR
jgi:hypothetical protein